MHRRLIVTCAALLVLCATARAAKADAPDADFESLHPLILPGKDDSRWMTVSWLPASDIWAARQKAAKEGKPIFLWYMAGEPLGPC
jgi:hypothetical protein